MNARVTPPAPGEAKPVEIPAAEAPKAAPAVAAPAQPEAPAKKKRSGRRLAIMLSVPVILAAGGGYFWLTGGRYVETDNAYVQQNKVSISADVAGRILGVAVKDN
jgi:membrane fusion protein (multidrug efflux system)